MTKGLTMKLFIIPKQRSHPFRKNGNNAYGFILGTSLNTVYHQVGGEVRPYRYPQTHSVFPENNLLVSQSEEENECCIWRIFYVFRNLLGLPWQSGGEDCASTATSIVPGQGTKILHAMWHGQKVKKNSKKNPATKIN